MTLSGIKTRLFINLPFKYKQFETQKTDTLTDTGGAFEDMRESHIKGGKKSTFLIFVHIKRNVQKRNVAWFVAGEEVFLFAGNKKASVDRRRKG